MNASRRAFLSRGSLGVALAGAAVLMPGLASVLKQPAHAPALGDLPAAGEPLVAHVRDLANGEISLMVGADHVVVRDVNLAGRLYGAALSPRPKAR